MVADSNLKALARRRIDLSSTNNSTNNYLFYSFKFRSDFSHGQLILPCSMQPNSGRETFFTVEFNLNLVVHVNQHSKYQTFFSGHTNTRPIALRGPLKWSVCVTRRHTASRTLPNHCRRVATSVMRDGRHNARRPIYARKQTALFVAVAKMSTRVCI